VAQVDVGGERFDHRLRELAHGGAKGFVMRR
jgi:hypothetical protein